MHYWLIQVHQGNIILVKISRKEGDAGHEDYDVRFVGSEPRNPRGYHTLMFERENVPGANSSKIFLSLYKLTVHLYSSVSIVLLSSLRSCLCLLLYLAWNDSLNTNWHPKNIFYNSQFKVIMEYQEPQRHYHIWTHHQYYLQPKKWRINDEHQYEYQKRRKGFITHEKISWWAQD